MSNSSSQIQVDSMARLAALQTVCSLLAATDQTELSPRLTKQLRELTGAKTVLLLGRDSRAAVYERLGVCPAHRAGMFSEMELQLFGSEQRRGALPRRPEELAEDDPLRRVLLQADVRSILRFPLYAFGELLGFVLLFDVPLTDQVQEVVATVNLLAVPIGLALKNASAMREIQRQKLEIERSAQEHERTGHQILAELGSSSESRSAARLAALNVMEDALEARGQTERVNAALRGEIEQRKQAEAGLQTSLEDKDILLKEIHHRVKNNLQVVASLLSLQASRTQDAQVRVALRDTQDRIRSMALLHEVLYRSQNLAHVDIAAYVQELCRHLLRSSGTANVRVRIEHHVARVNLPLEQAVPCGLLINELVSNAIKHGFPGERTGRVTVELQPAEGPAAGPEAAGQRLVLCVSDDGVGLPPDLDARRTNSLGLKLVDGLSKQLEGELTIQRSAAGGAAFQIVFSAAAAAGTTSATAPSST